MLALVALAGAGTGVAILVVFRLLTNPEKVRRARGRLVAHVLEMRLYGDEPGVVLRAWRDMIAANVRYIGLVLPATVVIAVPLVVAYPYLDGLFGRRPLAPGSETVITAVGPDAALEAGGAVALSSPAVHIVRTGEVSWRLRALAAGQGTLRLTAGGTTTAVPVWVGDEMRLMGSTGPIDIPYPSARLSGFGVEWPWEVWFLVFSSIAALALRRAFGVQF